MIYSDSPSIPMQVKNFKYLGRVYSCKLKHLDLEELNDEVNETYNDSNQEASILLVQIIDNSSKGDALYSSHHPMQFYALGRDEFDERIILSGPVVFKN